MANNIDAAEMLEEQIDDLKRLLVGQQKIAEQVGDGSLDHLVLHTKQLIEQNTKTAKHIRATAQE